MVRAVLRVIHPRELRATCVLGDASIEIGRTPGPGGFAIDHTAISRKHARLWWDKCGHHALRDLDSRHGTEVGHQRLTVGARALADGDLIRMGDVLAVYERGASTDAPDVDRDALPGDSPAMVALRSQVALAAVDPAPVLITGETGTGKEWVAREIHRLSGRRGPLVAVNCATLTAQMAESQLFGHAKGAFTGATADHEGWFREAEGGTLLLDELGELPADLQPKLLRVVQDSVVRPLGGRRPIAVDVRLVAATNRPLTAAVERGTFRRDLFARLARTVIVVPPLRDRKGDIVDWIERLWSHWLTSRDLGDAPLDLRPAAARVVVAHPWHDNLRGLERLVHELATNRDGAAIPPSRLPAWLSAAAVAPPPRAPASDPPQPTDSRPAVPSRDQFLDAWRQLGGSARAVARHFGRDRKQIYRWMDAYGVRRPSVDDE
jgi:DNA-binding NtrC family response regulator